MLVVIWVTTVLPVDYLLEDSQESGSFDSWSRGGCWNPTRATEETPTLYVFSATSTTGAEWYPPDHSVILFSSKLTIQNNTRLVREHLVAVLVWVV